MARANELVAEAAIKSAEAAIRQAELDLSYTEIHAPFSGRIGRINVSEGEVVGPTTGPLVTLVRERPVHVAFSLSEKAVHHRAGTSGRNAGDAGAFGPVPGGSCDPAQRVGSGRNRAGGFRGEPHRPAHRRDRRPGAVSQ
ncbi:efflux RND transporter periplasmic adaptor subunit [Jhaorihella thermophila]